MLLKFKYRFESAHRFLEADAPSCQTPHGHTWYATAMYRVKSRTSFGPNAMAAEFGAIKKSWKQFITETADHSYMHNENDPIVTPLKKVTPGARLLPFPSDPTTEMIAGLFALKLRVMNTNQDLEIVGVQIHETPTNSLVFKFEKSASGIPSWLDEKISGREGWWSSSDPAARHLKPVDT